MADNKGRWGKAGTGLGKTPLANIPLSQLMSEADAAGAAIGVKVPAFERPEADDDAPAAQDEHAAPSSTVAEVSPGIATPTMSRKPLQRAKSPRALKAPNSKGRSRSPPTATVRTNVFMKRTSAALFRNYAFEQGITVSEAIEELALKGLGHFDATSS